SSAEALAYLGSPSGCEELGRAAAKYPIVRSYTLSALASLDEAASVLQLRNLIVSDLDDEVRAGAFRALWLLNQREPLVRGERLTESFGRPPGAPQPGPLATVSRVPGAGVVLLGKPPAFRPPFSLLAGEYTVTASAEGASATISWVAHDGRTARKVCSLELEE